MKNNHGVKDTNDRTLIVMLTLQEKEDFLASPTNYARQPCYSRCGPRTSSIGIN